VALGRPAPDEAREVRWVEPAGMGDHDIAPAILVRIRLGLHGGAPAIA
jgi:hypothetical protein